jgi:hypothetical protein
MLGLFFDAQVTKSGFGHELTPSNTSDFLTKKRFNSLSFPQAENPEGYCPDTLSEVLFLVALRQELFCAFMQQRLLQFPLGYYNSYRRFAPRNDVIWSNRLVGFCADVFQFCFGASEMGSAQTPERSQWDALEAKEAQFKRSLPSSFEPLYCQTPSPENGDIFPEIWYRDDCCVTGIMHAELSGILLSAFDPKRPKLGLGYTAGANALVEQLRASSSEVEWGCFE